MKSIRLFGCMVLTAWAVFSGTLSAEEIAFGRRGEAVERERISWQPIYFRIDGHEVIAEMPGSPTSTMRDGEIEIYSFYQDDIYYLSYIPKEAFSSVSSYEEFFQSVVDAVGDDGEVIAVEYPGKGVVYVAEVHLLWRDWGEEIDHIDRVYVTPHAIYRMGVEKMEKDASLDLAIPFLETFEVVPE